MLVWRRGNYGTSRPFWDTGIDLRMTQHLYVMGASVTAGCVHLDGS